MLRVESTSLKSSNGATIDEERLKLNHALFTRHESPKHFFEMFPTDDLLDEITFTIFSAQQQELELGLCEEKKDIRHSKQNVTNITKSEIKKLIGMVLLGVHQLPNRISYWGNITQVLFISDDQE